jgi:putative MATE family efflux protein
LFFLVIACFINIGLDLLFVLGMNMEVLGVALATVISQIICAVSGIIYAYKKISFFQLTKEQMKPDFKIILKSIKLGIPVAFQNSMIAVSCMVLQGAVNSYGETVMATFTITSRIEQFVQQPYSSLGLALTTFTGQNIGANKQDRVKQGFRQAVMMIFIFSMILLPLVYIFGDKIIGIFVKSTETEVIQMGVKALRITSLCYFGLGMIYIPRAILNGSGDTGFSMINGITEVVCRIAYSNGFMRIPQLGYWSVWITTGATWVTTSVVCLIRYWSGKWKSKRVV